MSICPICSAPVVSRGMSQRTNPVIELFICTGDAQHLLQGVLQEGFLHLFQTRVAGTDQKSVYSIRLSAAQVERIAAACGVTSTGRARVQKWVDENV